MKYDALGYYQLLGLSPQAGDEQIKQSYRDLAKFWHPDHNPDPNALEHFQKLSVAYETLKDEESRLRYDILSMVYSAADYPEYESIAPFSDAENDANLRAFVLQSVRGKLWKHTFTTERKILSQKNAFKVIAKNAVGNWLLGWLHPKAFIKNIRALNHNYHKSFSLSETKKILLHNIVAYQKQENLPLAVSSAIVALDFAEQGERTYLERFISGAGIRVSRPQAWNMHKLKLAQLIFPLSIITLSVIGAISGWFVQEQMKNWWGNSKEIAYYQEVNTGYQKRTVDDVVVGKIHNIPVNKRDLNRLYHLQQDAVIMYGPSDDFDELKKISAKTTVRLTGYSPDNVWARILIDNGEMGFVRMNLLAKGIGKEIPFGSAVYER